MSYLYVTTNHSEFLTPFKRISHEVISQTPTCIHSRFEYENGLICESKVFSDRTEITTNMEFVTKDNIIFELRK